MKIPQIKPSWEAGIYIGNGVVAKPNNKMNAVMKYEAICGELLIDPALPFEDVEFITFFKGLKGKGLKPPEHWVLIKKYLEENY